MKTYVRSGENAFVPQNQRINLALGTVASSDCSEIDAGPEYAVDGDFSTWWESGRRLRRIASLALRGFWRAGSFVRGMDPLEICCEAICY